MTPIHLLRAKPLGLLLLSSLLLAIGCRSSSDDGTGSSTSRETAASQPSNDHGAGMQDPQGPKRITKTDAEWKEVLSPTEFYVLREAGTERPFSGDLLKEKREGVFVCAACEYPLYRSSDKFDSGTGWPSFTQPTASTHVAERTDPDGQRVEILCSRCDGHLGHVFEDGPAPIGRRHCVNAVSLDFVEMMTGAESMASDDADRGLPKPAQDLKSTAGATSATAVLAGGCFWCTEAALEELRGVLSIEPGYAGGTADNAKYERVGSGATKHAEAIEVIYNPEVLSYGTLLRAFFTIHNPTQKDRQGPDYGRQYRTAIFFANDAEKRVAKAYIDELNQSGEFSTEIATTLEPLEKFYIAEEKHRDFVAKHPQHPYVRAHSLPKIDTIRETYPSLVKKK